MWNSLIVDNVLLETDNAYGALKMDDSVHSVFIQEYSLVSEFNLLKNHVGPGLYVIPAAKTPFIWFGVIFVHSGIYESGIFRFSLFIPHTFPECNVSPTLVFESSVFHPLVDPVTNELFLGNNSSLTNWRKNVSHLWQVIDYLKNIFYNIDTDGPVNERAASLYESNRDEYIELAEECVEISKRNVYEKSNDDPHYLLFDKYDFRIHEPFREMLRKYKNILESEDGRPISWVQRGSLEPLSKND